MARIFGLKKSPLTDDLSFPILVRWMMRLTLRLLTCQRFSVKSRRRGRSRSHRPKQVQIRCALKTQKRAHNLLFGGKIILYVSKKKMCRTYTCKICISWVLQTSSFIPLKLEKCAILIWNLNFQICIWTEVLAKINVIFITPSDHSFGLAAFEKNARNVDFS